MLVTENGDRLISLSAIRRKMSGKRSTAFSTLRWGRAMSSQASPLDGVVEVVAVRHIDEVIAQGNLGVARMVPQEGGCTGAAGLGGGGEHPEAVLPAALAGQGSVLLDGGILVALAVGGVHVLASAAGVAVPVKKVVLHLSGGAGDGTGIRQAGPVDVIVVGAAAGAGAVAGHLAGVGGQRFFQNVVELGFELPVGGALPVSVLDGAGQVLPEGGGGLRDGRLFVFLSIGCESEQRTPPGWNQPGGVASIKKPYAQFCCNEKSEFTASLSF